MYFIRLEAEGLGPYHNGHVPLEFDDYNRHPTPSDDGIGHMNSWEICGFESEKKLLEWFNVEMLKAIRRASTIEGWRQPKTYYIVEYESPDDRVRIGRRQCVADRDMLVEKSRVSLDFFIEFHETV